MSSDERVPHVIDVRVRTIRETRGGIAVLRVRVASRAAVPLEISFALTERNGTASAVGVRLRVGPGRTMCADVPLPGEGTFETLATHARGANIDIDVATPIPPSSDDTHRVKTAVALAATAVIVGVAVGFAIRLRRERQRPIEPPPSVDVEPVVETTLPAEGDEPRTLTLPAIVETDRTRARPDTDTQTSEPVQVVYVMGPQPTGSENVAPVMRIPRRHVSPWAAAGFAAAGAVAFAVAAGVATGVLSATPKIDELTVPALAHAGSRLDVRYHVSGVGSVDYAMIAQDGTRVAAGTLHDHAGTIRLRLPVASDDRVMTVQLSAANVFGQTRSEARTLVERAAQANRAERNGSPAIGAPPRIVMLSLDRSQVAGGGRLTVEYDVRPPIGTLFITDATGAVLASTRLNAAGRSTLAIPPSDRHRDVAVVLRAQHGTVAESRLPLRIDPGPREPAALSVARGPNPDVQLITPTASSGGPITMQINSPYDSLHVRVVDARQRAVVTTDRAAGEGRQSIPAPSVTRPTTYTIQATLQRGVSVSTSFYSVRVIPARRRHI